MIQWIYALDNYLPIYISEFRKYLLQNSSVSFSGHILHKRWTNSNTKFEYLSMLPLTTDEVSMMDLLFIIHADRPNQSFAVYGDYAIQIPLAEALKQVEKNDEIAFLEGKMNVSPENFKIFLQIYSQTVFSKQTIDKMKSLKDFVQSQQRSIFEQTYYDYCESILTSRNLRLKALLEGNQLESAKQYHQFR